VLRLSGGERRRLQLARVLSQPCNLLVLDEPTNDLDLETLEMLEELLIEYRGTLLVVSHDRVFLDNVVTSTLVFEGAGQWREYVGGYEDWLRQKPADAPAPEPRPERPKPQRAGERARRMGFKDRRELGDLPGRIEALEREREEWFARMSAPEFYAAGGEEIARAKQRLAALETEIHAAYARWTELDAQASGGG